MARPRAGWRRLCALAVLGIAVQSVQAESFTVFDVPGAVSVGLVRLNNAGMVSGLWTDAANVERGFVRDAAGVVTSFELPGALAVEPRAINDRGVVVGSWSLPDLVSHGFIRTPDGALQTYDVPGSTATALRGLNSAGDMVGTYSTPGGGGGFVRYADGTLLLLAAVSPWAINDAGDISGTAGGQGWLRRRDGTEQRFDVPGAPPTDGTAQVRGLNRDGVVAGYGGQLACGPRSTCTVVRARSFVRQPDGTLVDFTLRRGARAVSTQALAINAAGAVAGTTTVANRAQQGFVRTADGRITAFTVPGMQLTTANAINDAGVVAGITADAGGTHAYLRTP